MTSTKRKRITLAMCMVLVTAWTARATTVENPRCEYLKAPLGIDVRKPRLCWTMVSNQRGQKQTAYQVLVASSAKLLEGDIGDLWDSRKVESNQSIHIEYAGKPLKSRMQCHWKVRVWDKHGRISDWSQPAFWTMGLLDEDDWKARWIGLDREAPETLALMKSLLIRNAKWIWSPERDHPAKSAPADKRFFRRVFELPKDRIIRKSRLQIACDNEFTLWVNDRKVGSGDDFTTPALFTLEKFLKPGMNVLAVESRNAGNQPNPAGLIVGLNVDFNIGKPLQMVTDDQWRVSQTAPVGWKAAVYDDHDWQKAVILGDYGAAPWGHVGGRRGEEYRLPARYLRQEFHVKKRIKRATVYICGLGFFDLFLNGKKVGDHVMDPAFTYFSKRVMYLTFDVTQQLNPGFNALGVILGNGRFYGQRSWVPNFGYPKLLFQFEIEYLDGTHEVIVSDGSWRISDQGPIRANNEFDGEEYDARLEMDGWAAIHFDDTDWENARLVSAPGGMLQAQMIEPMRVTQVLKPVSITRLKPGVHIVDFGQSFYGAVRLKTKGPEGAKVQVRMAYALRSDGSLKTEDNRSAKATDIYILRGKGEETWSPRFKGQGFRRIELSGFPRTPTTDDFAGLVIHTDMKPVGDFACSNELINRIHSNIRWGQRMYRRSAPLDPDRDERQGWLGDPAKNAESDAYNFDVAAFYTKWLGDIRLDQRDDGSLSNVSPALYANYTGDIVWPSVITILPEWAYHFYGDLRIVEENYACAKKWMASMAQSYVCTYGDWCDVASATGQADDFGATSRELIGAAYFYHNCRLMARMARLLGKKHDCQHYTELAAKRRSAFHECFFNPSDHTYESKTQCAAVLPLAFGLVPQENRTPVIMWLVNDIIKTNRGHLTVGLVGMQWYMQVLSDIGRPDVAYTVATQTSFPSWGYMVAHDATTIWERWDYDQRDPGMNSEALLIQAGNLNAWFYQTLAGINCDPESPGFKKIIIKPEIPEDLTWVKCHYDSIHGRIVSNWKRENGTLALDVTIPPNTTATVHLPTKNPASVLESGKKTPQAECVKFLRLENNRAVYQIGSGTYQFESRLQPQDEIRTACWSSRP